MEHTFIEQITEKNPTKTLRKNHLQKDAEDCEDDNQKKFFK
jgi:hypothetical protein